MEQAGVTNMDLKQHVPPHMWHIYPVDDEEARTERGFLRPDLGSPPAAMRGSFTVWWRAGYLWDRQPGGGLSADALSVYQSCYF